MDINQLVQQILASGNLNGASNVQANPINQALGVASLNNISTPDVNDYVKRAFEQMKPYYAKLLEQAQGDTNLAISNLKADYDMGLRFIDENLNSRTRQEQESLAGALESLGITFGKEDEALTDSLNKRGMAVTESAPGQALDVMTAGEGGKSASLLTQDQSLRREAEQRTTNQNLENMGLKAKQDTESSGSQFKQDVQGTLQKYRDTSQGYQTQAENQALQVGSMNQSQANTAAQLQLQKDQLNKQTGGGGGGSGGSSLAGADRGTRMAAWRAAGNQGDLPEGWFG